MDASSLYPWNPGKASSVEIVSNVEIVSLGGGYEFSIEKGIHPHRRRISVVHNRIAPSVALEMESFLTARGNDSFLMRDPHGGEVIRVRLSDGPTREPEGKLLRRLAFEVIEVFEA
jgi:phage-related protein